MHSRSIKDLWDLPQLKIVRTKKIDKQIFIHLMPIESKQSCPVCTSDKPIRRGFGYVRDGTFLDVIPGRRINELQAHFRK